MAGNPKCTPLNINPDVGPVFPMPGPPGFGLDINFGTIPKLLPDGIPENIFAWLNRLKLKLPGGGILQSIIDGLQKSISQIISEVLTMLSTFLNMYMFILAIIDLVVCIIRVMKCGMPNIPKTVKRIKRLVRKCIPLFISICFPWIVLLLLILALIQILIAIVEYIIEIIKRLIKQIKKNLEKLREAYTKANTDAALAIVSKLGNLMCLFEHIFILLGAVAGIFELILSIFRPIKFCNDGSGSSDDAGMCTEFLRDPEIQINEESETWLTRMKNTTGTLVFTNTVIGSPFSIIPSYVGISRTEQIYLYDQTMTDPDFYLSNIISSTISEDPGRKYPFFPPNTKINIDTPEYSIPYFVNLKINCDPNDGYGTRDISINNVIVNYPTTTIYDMVIGGIPRPASYDKGFLAISDGYTVDSLDQYNGYDLTTLVKAVINDPNMTDATLNDGYSYDITTEYQLAVNFEALATYQLISMSCIPSMALEDQILEQSYSDFFNEDLQDHVTLPDVNGAMDSMAECITAFRNDMSIEQADIFESCMNDALEDLKTQAETALCQTLTALIDPHTSTATLSPDMQFPGQPIKVEVALNLTNGQSLFDNLSSGAISPDCLQSLADKLICTPTLGTSTPFSYDGYGLFVCDIISQVTGTGIATISFDGVVISEVVRPDDLNESSYISSGELNYTYVGFETVEGDGLGQLGKPIRDESDRSSSA